MAVQLPEYKELIELPLGKLRKFLDRVARAIEYREKKYVRRKPVPSSYEDDEILY